MDHQSVYSARVYDANFGQSEDTRLQLQAQLEAFILDFRHDNHFVYRYDLCTGLRRYDAEWLTRD